MRLTVADEFAEYKKAISQYPENSTINVVLPDEYRRYHYSKEHTFAAVIRPNGEFLRFIPVVRLH